MSVHLRPAALADLPSLVALDQAEFGGLAYPLFVFRQFWDISAPLFWVAEIPGGALVGYVLGAVAPVDRSAWCLSLAVAQTHQGQGLGKKLMHTLLTACHSFLCPAMYLSVAPDNAPAIALYERLGFVTVGENALYFGEGNARLKMRLELGE